MTKSQQNIIFWLGVSTFLMWRRDAQRKSFMDEHRARRDEFLARAGRTSR